MAVPERLATSIVALGSDTLAGSSTNLLQEVKNLVAFGFKLEEAIYAVSTAPEKPSALAGAWVKSPPVTRRTCCF